MKFGVPRKSTEIVKDSSQFRPEEVAALWISIYNVVDPGYWQQHSWISGSQTPRTLYDHLANISCEMIRRFFKYRKEGPKSHRNVSPEYCIRLLEELSGASNPILQLPSSEMSIDNDTQHWETRPEVFPAAYISPLAVQLVKLLQVIPCMTVKLIYDGTELVTPSMTPVDTSFGREISDDDDELYATPPIAKNDAGNQAHGNQADNDQVVDDQGHGERFVTEENEESENVSEDESQADVYQDEDGNM